MCARCAVLDESELKRQTDLRSRYADARSVVHRLFHPRDQLLRAGRQNFFWSQRPRSFAKDRLPTLHDLETHNGFDCSLLCEKRRDNLRA